MYKKALSSLCACTLALTSTLSSIAYADNNPGVDSSPTSSQTQDPVYGGFSLSLLSDTNKSGPSLNPYGKVSMQDLAAGFTGYGIIQLNFYNQSNVQEALKPLVMNPDSPSPDNPALINAPNSLAVGIATMLDLEGAETSIPQKAYTSNDNPIPGSAGALEPIFFPLNSSYNFSCLNDKGSIKPSEYIPGLNKGSAQSSALRMSPCYLKPFDPSSMFHYELAQPTSTRSPLSHINWANVYTALVSGSLSPVAIDPPEAGKEANYYMQLRRLAAIQAAGVYALQDIIARSVPNPNLPSQTLNNFTPDLPLPRAQAKNTNTSDANALSLRDLEEYMATRRLNPQSNWYNQLQKASPLQLQREQLYLQAEMLYELHQIRKTQEMNEMLLAVHLLGQNFANRKALNQKEPSSLLNNP